MSNRMFIVPTEFKDIRTGHITKGVRCSDDYANFYSNLWESIPNDDLEFLALCLEEFYFESKYSAIDKNKEYHMFFEWIVENQKGVWIGETYYEWGQIKHLFSRGKISVPGDEK